MTERWKYQTKYGLVYGTITAIVMTLFEVQEKSLYDAFVSQSFLLRLAVLVIAGIFILGYIQWRYKLKQANR